MFNLESGRRNLSKAVSRLSDVVVGFDRRRNALNQLFAVFINRKSDQNTI